MTQTQTAPKAEAKAAEKTKAQKFVDLAEKRVTKALNQIATLRGLANKNNYEYTPEQVAKILAAIRAEADTLEQAFAGKKAATGFSL